MNLPSSLTTRGSTSRDTELFDAASITRSDVTRQQAKLSSKAASLEKGKTSVKLRTGDDDGGQPELKSSLERRPSEDDKKAFDSPSNLPTPIAEQVPLAIFTDSASRLPGTIAYNPADHDSDDGSFRSNQDPPEKRLTRYRKTVAKVLKRHSAFIGPGIIASVGYTDPGNWVTDLAAGSQFGYALLFVVLLSGIFGIFLQILAVRMGLVTGHDLARNTRLLLLPDDDDRITWGNRPAPNAAGLGGRKPLRYRNLRIVTVWMLYLVSEGALIATELAELLGSAIALNLLFPGLPLWGGVLVTSADVMLVLFIYRPQGNFRIFELFIAGLVMVVLGCYIALLVKTKPDWGDVFHGYVPSSTLVEPQALYAGIGIVGAVIMPHALFLGSHYSTLNRLNMNKNKEADESDLTLARTQSPLPATGAEASREAGESMLAGLRKSLRARFSSVDDRLRERETAARPPLPSVYSSPRTATAATLPRQSARNMTIEEVKLHLPHASWDIALSLFVFAITINSAILIVAAAAFYYGPSGTRQLSDLYDAFNLLRSTLGKAYAILFAIALLAAGQSASITVTLAGQLVSEGFIRWRTNAFMRRLITRIITIIPSLAIAIGVGRNGLDEMLVASQVTLSFALPFVLVPLIATTAMKSKMQIQDEVDQEAAFVRSPAIVVRPPTIRTSIQAPLSANAIDTAHTTSASAVEVGTAPKKTPRSAGVQSILSRLRPGSAQTPAQTSSSARAVAQSSPLPAGIVQHDFTNPWVVTAFAILIYLVILLADFYTLVTTIMGKQ